ncbi:YdcF family protein [Actinoplanes sp. NPDC051633]|uniref:YdcF family protein n=1 Tax=Actinoplanes sp. NPDC051633 TaxID=3155670 RepID=UPI003421829C
MSASRSTAGASAPNVPDKLRSDVETLWNYHDLRHELHPCDVGIGLGSHDLGVAMIAVQLFRRGMFPRVVFTGANAPTTVEQFPRGEAVHYGEYAAENGVPQSSILIEPNARNTAENLTLTRDLLIAKGVEARSIILMSRPYQQRRAYATCRKVWPTVKVICASLPLSLDEYVANIGDVKKVIDMLVGDTQRIDEYARRGFAIPQDVPADVKGAFDRLVAAGYTSRLIPGIPV